MKRFASQIKVLDFISLVLVIVGAFNWLFVVFDFNLIAIFSFGIGWIEKVIYLLVGLGGIWMVNYMIQLNKISKLSF